MKLALVPTQIVSPKDNKPVMGIVQVKDERPNWNEDGLVRGRGERDRGGERGERLRRGACSAASEDEKTPLTYGLKLGFARSTSHNLGRAVCHQQVYAPRRLP